MISDLHQKQLCPTSHGTCPSVVALIQLQPQPSGPNFPSPIDPPFQGPKSRSMEFRDGGIKSDEWPNTIATAPNAVNILNGQPIRSWQTLWGVAPVPFRCQSPRGYVLDCDNLRKEISPLDLYAVRNESNNKWLPCSLLRPWTLHACHLRLQLSSVALLAIKSSLA